MKGEGKCVIVVDTEYFEMLQFFMQNNSKSIICKTLK